MVDIGIFPTLVPDFEAEGITCNQSVSPAESPCLTDEILPVTATGKDVVLDVFTINAEVESPFTVRSVVSIRSFPPDNSLPLLAQQLAGKREPEQTTL